MLGAVPAETRDEFMMGVNRLAAGTLMLAATAASAISGRGDLAFPHWPVAIGVWIALSLACFAHMLIRSRSHAVRRSLTLVLDVGGTSIILHATNGGAAFVYPAYLWIIIGYGLRFGPRYLIAASVLSILGFGLIVIVTPFWNAMPLSLTSGLVASLIILPVYSHLLVRRLALARMAAEAASRAKTLFLAGVSHELRTPLNAITGMAELLQGTRLDHDQASMVATVEASADVLIRLIGGLFDVSRVEAGHLRLSPATFDLTRLLGDVDRIISVQAREKGLRLNTFITARTPLCLLGDAARLREILLNLGANAAKFTAEGSITIAIDGEAEENGRIRLRAEVADTGIGIEAAAQGRIFEMFTQADDSIAARYGGTGMGLALCSKLIRLMGGEIGVTSEPGYGSTFWFVLPVEAGPPETEETPSLDVPVRVQVRDPDVAASLVARLQECAIEAQLSPRPIATGTEAPAPSLAFVDADDDPSPDIRIAVLARDPPCEGLPPIKIREAHATAVDVSGPDASLCRAVRIAMARLPAAATPPGTATRPAGRYDPSAGHILVADDNAVNRTVVTRILERAGYAVVTANDGEQALEALNGGGVDVALLDVNMPSLSGIDVARVHLFSAPPEARVPILGLTADATPETCAQCLAAGMIACLVKPFRSAALLDALGKALASHGRRDKNPARPLPADRALSSTLDPQALAELVEIGGQAFLAEVVQGFIDESERTIAHLEDAQAVHDVAKFRDQAHALCSGAANIGARGLRELCDPWQTISAATLEQAGPVLLTRLRGEWARTRAALLNRVG